MALNVQHHIGIHSGLEFVLFVGNVDFYLHGAGGTVERIGEARHLAGEMLARSLHGHVGGFAVVHGCSQRFRHRYAQPQDVDLRQLYHRLRIAG